VFAGSSPITFTSLSSKASPEVRVLCSAGVTRSRRSYDPVRLPPWPSPVAMLRPLPSPTTGLPRLPEPPFRRAVPTTPADRAGAHVDCFPARLSLPPLAGGSASALSLSRPAQASLALRPAGSLSHPRWPLARGSDPAIYPTKPLANFRTYRQLSGRNPPPLMIRAFGAHCQIQTIAGRSRAYDTKLAGLSPAAYRECEVSQVPWRGAANVPSSHTRAMAPLRGESASSRSNSIRSSTNARTWAPSTERDATCRFYLLASRRGRERAPSHRQAP